MVDAEIKCVDCGTASSVSNNAVEGESPDGTIPADCPNCGTTTSHEYLG